MPRAPRLWLLPPLIALSLAGACGARTELAFDDASLPPPSVPERCDGLDDDGDGRVDEGIAPIACGIGACAIEVPGCADGRVPTCRPRPPGTELCNDLDDDCDGRADEGLGFGDRREVALVRDAGEGTAGPCDTCGWAARVSMGATSEGLLATWRVGFDGLRPEPNVYARPWTRAAGRGGPSGWSWSRTSPRGRASLPPSTAAC